MSVSHGDCVSSGALTPSLGSSGATSEVAPGCGQPRARDAAVSSLLRYPPPTSKHSEAACRDYKPVFCVPKVSTSRVAAGLIYAPVRHAANRRA